MIPFGFTQPTDVSYSLSVGDVIRGGILEMFGIRNPYGLQYSILI